MGDSLLQIADVNRLRAVDPKLAYAFASDGPFLYFTGQGQTHDARTLPARAADAIIAQYRQNPETFEGILSHLAADIAEVSAGENKASNAFNWGLANRIQETAVELLHRAAESSFTHPLTLLYGIPKSLAEAVFKPAKSDLLGMLAVGDIEDDVVYATASVSGGRLAFMSTSERWDTLEARETFCANFLTHPQAYHLLKAGCSAQDIRAVGDTISQRLLTQSVFSGAQPHYAVAAIRAGVTDIDAIRRGSDDGTPIEYLAVMTDSAYIEA